MIKGHIITNQDGFVVKEDCSSLVEQYKAMPNLSALDREWKRGFALVCQIITKKCSMGKTGSSHQVTMSECWTVVELAKKEGIIK